IRSLLTCAAFSPRLDPRTAPRLRRTRSSKGCTTPDDSPEACTEVNMALFMIERNFAQALNLTPRDAKAVIEINGQTGVKWLSSFLTADRRKTFCLYEAESAEAIREAAR